MRASDVLAYNAPRMQRVYQVGMPTHPPLLLPAAPPNEDYRSPPTKLGPKRL